MGSRLARWALVVCVPLTSLTGCGEEQSAREPLPGLVQELDRIDDAIATGRYSLARAALEALVARASEARRSGDLDAARADDIAVAAAGLRAALPAVRPSTPEATTEATEEPTEEPTQEPSTSPTPRRHEESGSGKRHGKTHGKRHRKGHKHH